MLRHYLLHLTKDDKDDGDFADVDNDDDDNDDDGEEGSNQCYLTPAISKGRQKARHRITLVMTSVLYRYLLPTMVVMIFINASHHHHHHSHNSGLLQSVVQLTSELIAAVQVLNQVILRFRKQS